MQETYKERHLRHLLGLHGVELCKWSHVSQPSGCAYYRSAILLMNSAKPCSLPSNIPYSSEDGVGGPTPHRSRTSCLAIFQPHITLGPWSPRHPSLQYLDSLGKPGTLEDTYTMFTKVPRLSIPASGTWAARFKTWPARVILSMRSWHLSSRIRLQRSMAVHTILTESWKNASVAK
jgi:hypothetical protein